LVVRPLLHSPSSLKCEEGKTYNENIQFMHTIIQDIFKSKTSIVEFLHKCRRGWSSSEQAGPKITSLALVYIAKSVEDKGVEQ